MTITLHLDTEIENRLQAQVCDRGISLRDYLLEIAARQAQSDANSPELARKRLIDVLDCVGFCWIGTGYSKVERLSRVVDG